MVDCVHGVCNLFDCVLPDDETLVDKTDETATVRYPGLREGPKLILYISHRCPFCQKVLGYMEQKRIEVPWKDTSDLSNRQELIRIGGKKQIPCLVMDGKALYESNDIINWFEARLDSTH